MSTATQPAASAAAKSNVNIQIYNTLSRKKEPFETITAGKVGIYLCGPTVYKEAHMGHMVGPVIFDCIKRYLVYCGYDVTWVVNITDVDDKLIAEANKRGISMEQVAQENIADYLNNLAAMGVDQIDHMPKATETTDDIIRFIEQLVEKGFAYESEGDVYFEVSKDPGYGKLSNRSAEDQQGEGGDTASRKRASGDFALWKSAKPGEPSWESPWGQGRPGWHIECSAMSRNLLGETFDIHGGGLDLMFPHHENEIAQSECCHGKPMVKYWLHNGLMRASTATGKMGGRSEREAGASEDVEAAAAAKISRSAGAGGLHTLIDTHGGELLRFFLLRTHYRSTIVFGDEPLAEAGTALDTFHRLFERYQRITGKSFYELQAAATRAEGDFDPAGDELLVGVKQLRDRYLAKMDDDFNTGGAVSDLFELARLLNKYADQNDLEGAGKTNAAALASFGRGMSTLRELTSVLGIFREAPAAAGADSELTGKLMELLIEIRANARANKDFATGDLIRDKLTELGITLEDRKGETGWRFE